MTDPMLTLALIIACALVVVFYVKHSNARHRIESLLSDLAFERGRLRTQEATIAELLEKLEATEAALTKAVEAEWPRGAA